ncbi:CCDC22 family protein [Megaselia abdita]
MEEVDSIIIHSLKSIGCNIGEDVKTLTDFSPELLVSSVSCCISLIDPSISLPKTLPTNLAQRFSTTASLAETCVSLGFRGDIGYQSFLYSNVNEVRRVYMFLIEKLPKESDHQLLSVVETDPLKKLENQLSHSIKVQLESPWLPHYCNKDYIRRFDDKVIVPTVQLKPFNPEININIPSSSKTCKAEIESYWKKRSPTIFQQTKNDSIISTVLHKNDLDFYCPESLDEDFAKLVKRQNTVDFVLRDILIKTPSPEKSSKKEKLTEKPPIAEKPQNLSPVDKINVEISSLRDTIEETLASRKHIQECVQNFKEERVQYEKDFESLQKDRKVKERTCILLENPEVNLEKMNSLISSSEQRLNKIHLQWDEHRIPLEEALKEALSKNSDKFSKNKVILEKVKALKDKSSDIKEEMSKKAGIQKQYVEELQKADTTLSRNAHTSRILEIIGNIRKQKNDIDKVLRDTRELQKQINTLNGQLDRQFTATDDLLFKNAKKDEPSKRAYKFLATLHSDCRDLIALVEETGQVMREIRDIEDQIENEKTRYISKNLEKIMVDIKQVEKESAELQEKIKYVENKIVQG